MRFKPLLKKIVAATSALVTLVSSHTSLAVFAAEQESDNKFTSRALLIEDRLPWNSNANTQVLSKLKIPYDKTTASDFMSKDLGNYSVLIFANDQTFSTYSVYSKFMDRVEDFAWLGGVVVFGACDMGWASGTLNTKLPGGVEKKNLNENYNTIAIPSHAIVTGELTDNKTLKESDLYSTYCSHVVFEEDSLPKGSRVILRGKSSGKPTLVEYPVGNGKVIASGLTWEHSYIYSSSSYSRFAGIAMDDLFKYAAVNSYGDIDMCPPVALSVTVQKNVTRGKNFTIQAMAKNISDDKAKDVKILLAKPDNTKIITSGKTPEFGAEVLKPDESLKGSWVLRYTGDEKSISIPITLWYSDKKGENRASKTITKIVKISDDVSDKAIIMIPGIAGTRLYCGEESVGSKNVIPEEFKSDSDHNNRYYLKGFQFWEPQASIGTGKLASITSEQNEIQTEVMMLNCDSNGNSIANIKPEVGGENGDYGAQQTYTLLVNELKNAFGDDYAVSFFPYDWRKDVSNAAQELEKFIDDNGYDEVVLVCHSMGGVVASKYLANSASNREKVSKLITLGTPYLGSPKALYALETGGLMDNFSRKNPAIANKAATWFCMGTPLKAVANNITSVYELLPSKYYFNLNDTTYTQKTTEIHFGNLQLDKLDYNQTMSFIRNRDWYWDGDTQKNFISTAENVWDSLFVGNQHITSLVDSYYIMGYGIDTLLEVEEKVTRSGKFENCSDLTVTNGGDGTVPLISANIGGLAESGHPYYIQATHTDMVQDPSAIDLVKNIINGNPDLYSDKITETLPESLPEPHWYNSGNTVRIQLKIECPVDLAMIADDGSEWAYVSSDLVYNENTLDGTFYHFGKDNDSKMAYLQDNNFNVKLIGTDNGFMKYTMSVQDAGKELKRIIFENVEVTDSTVIYTNTDRFNDIVLDVDDDNDGIIDRQILPDYVLEGDEIEEFDNMRRPAYQYSNLIASDTGASVQIYAGQIHADKYISSMGTCQLNSDTLEADEFNAETVLFNYNQIESELFADYQEASEGIEAVFADTENVMPEDAVGFESCDMIYYSEQNLTDFISDHNIEVYLDKVTSEDDCKLYSRNGNITLSGSNINFSGIIYAPEGTVILSAENIHVHGTIIAKNVIIYGNVVTMN